MSNAKIDKNKGKTAIAVDTGGDIENLLVDPTTGRLLVTIDIVSSTTPSANARTRIDENKEWTSQATDGNGDPQPLLIDNRNDSLWIDMTVE